jgi:uncharacterized protein YecE (DUF72 family)
MERRIGTAGWSIAGRVADRFPAEGSALERYSARFSCAEINSSFHRSHRPGTWTRWAASVPGGFRFSAKLPRAITHAARLADCDEAVDAALAEMASLGEKLEILIVQLPPSLGFDPEVAGAFFGSLRARWPRSIACEPRHLSWFEPAAEAMLISHRIARIGADPALSPAAARPGGWKGLLYYRLHGSPARYRSSYDDGRIEALAAAIASANAPLWCIFDNTASSGATGDALKLSGLVGAQAPARGAVAERQR